MTVGQLVTHLRSLASLLDASGARTAAELNALCDALNGRAALSLSTLAAELSMSAAPPAIAPPLPRTPPTKKGSPDLETLLRETQQTYESASSPAITLEMIDDLLTRLAPLTKDSLVVVAERIGLKGMAAKTKPAIQAAIKDRIVKRKAVITRASMTDRL
jgi:hypothetical protein